MGEAFEDRPGLILTEVDVPRRCWTPCVAGRKSLRCTGF